jgi:hypothetical protein
MFLAMARRAIRSRIVLRAELDETWTDFAKGGRLG